MTETTNTQLDALETDNTEHRGQQKRRLDFLNALHAAFKGARFFPPQNESVIKKIRQLLDMAKGILEEEGACNVQHTHGFLMLNGTRIKTDVAGLVPYNFMMDTMARLKTGLIAIEQDITFEDMRTFLYVFAKLDPKDSDADPFQAFTEAVEREGLNCITLDREDQQELATRNEDIRRQSIDIYFRSISVARNILQNAHAGKAVNFRRAKRAVQTMVDIAMKNRFFLVAMTSIKNYDEYTYNHSSNVAVLSITFGQHLGFSRKLLGSLGMAALLHDIGKTDIDKELLNKPGKLTRDEWDVLKSHPMLGVKRLLNSADMNEMLIRAIIVTFQHHKRADLQGYPRTQSNRELNLFSKIVAIADCYDALTTPRVYRSRSYSAAEAISIMLDDAGSIFDPLLLNQFSLFLSLYPVGTMLELDTGEAALVYRVRHEPERLDRPTVKIVANTEGARIDPFVADLSETDPDGEFQRNVVGLIAPSKYFDNLEEYFKLL